MYDCVQSEPSQPADDHLTDESVPWSCVQDEIEVPASRRLTPGSDKAYDLIAKWYTTCRQKHDDCNIRKRTEGPARLLYLGPQVQNYPDIIRLVDFVDTESPEYIALSHCWGSGAEQPIKTIMENIELRKTGIETASLSRTFRDAIAVSRRLGVQYLWIDALCIIQDDTKDKANEIPRMHNIYEGAALTISAMSARDGRGGCWIPRRRVFNVPSEDGRSIRLAFHRSIELAGQHASFLSSQADTDLETQYPLATRKWTLQERLLSRRVLHFTAQDFVWECRHTAHYACSTVDMLPPDHTHQNIFKVLNDQAADKIRLIFDWMELVVQFSFANLSDETDVFPALAGLASAFSEKPLGAYCAGLWESSLPVALCWYTDQAWYTEATTARPSKYVAPTWSWGSVQGTLCFDALYEIDNDLGRFRRVSKLVSVACKPSSPDGFGHVQPGSRLTIFSPTFKCPPGSVAATTISGFEGAEFRVDTLDDIPWQRECFLALIFTKRPDESQALVLVANDDGTHRRCGLVCLPDQTLHLFSEFMELEIV